ncbi:3-hydroxyacyl-CoA dehydrogenase NAD-binding domain-containing protein [Granulosicoccus antarcticus]|uniref:enoyl-CoA hydratase n=1 Tax=Granulosicoccus antarcticus IMCC3135 TaxID=1192854 RepID=A0A2Z2P0A8_9GAMM|nr:3-hydroxyacyl-CoA dehydrogenase NAD-binding domain-containing protein [Granulosicoccus antarcticus]ASJ75508.1 Fatty acid oxidation complex subunit alpha [Granulosicoccus antarcticus IMCC3135]
MTTRFGSYDHWQIDIDVENIVWLLCDRQGEGSNSLSEAVIRELGGIVEEIESLNPVGVVVGSAKPASFILGADIREFDRFTQAADVTNMIKAGHEVFARLENLPCPTVAAIHGFALGGGLELALCCDYIVALNVPETRVGFPEVKLGIFPGLGGTTRLTERVGGLEGMQLMLTARMLRAPAARKAGVIDELVDEFSSLHWAARRAILQKRKKHTPSAAAALTNRQPARSVLAQVLRRKTAEKANPEHYPAPFRMIDMWAENRDNRRRMFEAEAEQVGQLMVSDTARNLRRVFFMTERMKSLGKGEDFKVRRVHVVGAGVMGGDIAAWCVLQGMEVTLQDRELKHIEPALKRAKALFRKRLRKKPAVSAALSRLMADVEGDGVPRADVIIEAIYEDADAKRALYASIEPRMAAHAILATNTSALPLESLTRDMAAPERLIGLHFFNPVAKMPLVEVVHGEQTAKSWIARGCAFSAQINRFPLPTKSSPGFLVNRVLAPYLMEAFTLMLEGLDKELIDASAIRFGMPMGPIELADVVGLDVCMKVAETLASGDVEAQRELLQKKLDEGHLGKKSGQGFYVWAKGRANRRKLNVDSPYGDQIAARLMKPFLAECQAASAEGIVADDELLDAGIIFGTGFAPFLGGPMHYLEQQEANA